MGILSSAFFFHLSLVIALESRIVDYGASGSH